MAGCANWRLRAQPDRSTTDWNSLLGRVSSRAWREDGALRVRLG